jgi:hypothetical protein
LFNVPSGDFVSEARSTFEFEIRPWIRIFWISKSGSRSFFLSDFQQQADAAIDALAPLRFRFQFTSLPFTVIAVTVVVAVFFSFCCSPVSSHQDLGSSHETHSEANGQLKPAATNAENKGTRRGEGPEGVEQSRRW